MHIEANLASELLVTANWCSTLMFESDAVLVRVKCVEEYNQSLVVAHKFQMRHLIWAAKREISIRYREILNAIKDKLVAKGREATTDIELQEVAKNLGILEVLHSGRLMLKWKWPS